MQFTTIGFDVAKNVFQVHGVGSVLRRVVRRKLRRTEVLSFFEGMAPCLVGLEACASAHHWAREIAKLGHEVRLMLPQYVRPYVKQFRSAREFSAWIGLVPRQHNVKLLVQIPCRCHASVRGRSLPMIASERSGEPI